jgi:cytidine deaminase
MNNELIEAAVAVLHPYRAGDRLFGDVAAALVTEAGNVYVGVCIDTASGTGFCAEHAAIAAMVTAREYKIAKIVAVWRNEGQGPVHVLPPCGRCREFIRQIDPANLNTEVILGRHRTTPLHNLLPETNWPTPLD